MTAPVRAPAAAKPEDGLDPALLKTWFVLVLGPILALLDTTIVTVGLDSIARDFRSPLATLQWVSAGYLLAISMVMPLPEGEPMKFRLLSVHAHPDDESSKGAATLAKYAAEGVDVMVATCTGGERGDVLNPAMDRPEIRADLTAVRRAEMEAARVILGVRQRFLGFVDSGLPGDGEPLPDGCFARTPLPDAARPLVALIREFRPHVVVTYDETGGYPHPDHIKTHEVTAEAFDAVADPTSYPGTGEPWQPAKLYYQGAFSKEWFQALHDGMTERGLESGIAPILAEWPDTSPKLDITTRVPCAEYFAVRDKALLAHASQIDPNAGFMVHSRDVERAVSPTEDYHLARTHVETYLPEQDLFAGLVRGR